MKLRRRIPLPVRAQKAVPDRTAPPAPSRESSASEVVGNLAFAGTAASPASEVQAPLSDVPLESTRWLSDQNKPEFLAQLREQVNATAADALAGTGFTPANCPWIQYWFAYYAGRSAEQIEQAAARFAPETRGLADPAAIIPFLAARIRRGVERWAVTGELTGVPGDVPLRIPGGPSPSGVFFAGRVGGVTAGIDPRLLRLRLGAGRPLPAPVRSRMESVFRLGFPQVRIHTDATADALARRLEARAFAVGQDVAFRSGEYRPGTPVGDALIAHELAHTVQQRDATSPARPSRAAEADANRSTRGFLGRLWEGARSAMSAPAYRGGLALQRCDDKPAAEKKVDSEKVRRATKPHGAAPEPAVPTPAAPKPSATAEGVAEVAETNPAWRFQYNMEGTGMYMNPAFWEVRYFVDKVSKPFVGNSSRTAFQQVDAYGRKANRMITVERIEVGLKAKVKASDAVKDMLTPGQQKLYGTECFTAQALVQFAGVYKRMEKEIPNTADAQFDANYSDFLVAIPYTDGPSAQFGGKKLKTGFDAENPNSGKVPWYKLKEILDSKSDKGLLRGDWVYISNAEFIKSGAFQGENATYLGGKKFYGHGLGVFTIEEYVTKLQSEYNVKAAREEILDKVTVGPRHRPPQDVAGFP